MVDFDRSGVEKAYGMFCTSVDRCLCELGKIGLSDERKKLLERRLNVTFLMTDFSLGSLEIFSDSYLDKVRDGVDKRVRRWEEYKALTFRPGPLEINNCYNNYWLGRME